ncbi:MAG: hypothetical protein UT53_C0013G0012, partial [Candidatus Yanofskybacteria bacterium GW2011_GWD2_39_48]
MAVSSKLEEYVHMHGQNNKGREIKMGR